MVVLQVNVVTVYKLKETSQYQSILSYSKQITVFVKNNQIINATTQQLKEIWSNSPNKMNNNAFLSSTNVENIIKILTPHRSSLHIIALSDEVTMEFCKEINVYDNICQGVFIKKCNRKNNMSMCINCENDHWNKLRREKRKINNYDEQIKAGSHTNVVLLSPERLKKRVKNENHRRKVTSLT